MSNIEAIAMILAIAVLMLLMLNALLLTALFHEITMRAMWRNAYHDAQAERMREALAEWTDAADEPAE